MAGAKEVRSDFGRLRRVRLRLYLPETAKKKAPRVYQGGRNARRPLEKRGGELQPKCCGSSKAPPRGKAKRASRTVARISAIAAPVVLGR